MILRGRFQNSKEKEMVFLKNHRGTKKRFMAVALSLAMIATAAAGTGHPAAAAKAVKVKKLTLKKR